MNYYIQGDAANADKIRAAFEKLGYDVTGFDMCNDNILFFTYKLQGGGKVISTTNANLYTADIIKSHPDYKELELPVKPNFKVGDWVVYNGASVWQVNEIDRNMSIPRYELTNNDGDKLSVPFTSEYNLKEWTIRDAKDGDVLVTTKIRSCPFIYRKTSYKNNLAYYYVGINGNGDLTDAYPKNTLCHFGFTSDVVPATKEQRDLLFAKMREAGYEWDAYKKELRKIKPHYDIANFKPFDRVLVRQNNDNVWGISLFSRCEDNEFCTCNNVWFNQCIPFNDDTKHLLGTTDMCPEEYINW